MEKINYNLEDIVSVSAKIISKCQSRIICLFGELGAGKTTLIKQFLLNLGAKDFGSSPTFTIANHYHDMKDQLIAYHLDCYRLESVEEALDLGIEDYFTANCFVFIEWPERIASILPDERTEIHIRTVNSFNRELTLVNLP